MSSPLTTISFAALGCRWRLDAGVGEDCDVCVLRVYSLADDVSLFRI